MENVFYFLNRTERETLNFGKYGISPLLALILTIFSCNISGQNGTLSWRQFSPPTGCSKHDYSNQLTAGVFNAFVRVCLFRPSEMKTPINPSKFF